ncbi:MAG: hypothetical protein GVY02_02850 [Bacteroidetes bacterium]|jgi:uncharacterized protein with NRDE domain|nr:hypothetical protein [Bacteroidota bacterium]
MCLIVFSFKTHPKYPFILAANRDEFYERPTAPLHRWDTDPPLIAGKDEKAGGTWLGLTPDGRVGFLTNYRKMSESKNQAPSRGHLVTDILLSDDQPRKKIYELQKRSEKYNGFNLIGGYVNNLLYISNRLHGVHKIKPGLHGISNALLNTSWPKTDRAKGRFEELLKADEPDESEIFNMLRDEKQFPPDQLPDTGLSHEMEKAVSSIFIQTPEYGTRCSTLLKIDRENYATIVENTYKKGTNTVKNSVRVELQLKL